MHLQREIENLKTEILTLGAIVEQRVRESILAIEKHDESLAKKIIDKDIEIDRKEVEIEETCLKILALHQPVAIDLRFIIAVLKINNDLERIGDLAVNIAERGAFLCTQPPVYGAFNFIDMAAKAQKMLKQSLDALVNLSAETARDVCTADDEIDAMNRQVYILIQNMIHTNPDQTECLVHLLSVSRHLERIADHATNIAEDVLYMVEGEIVRHKTEKYQANLTKNKLKKNKKS
ncbi:MAG: phosphate signaling complex protein PhoU [Sedimentisphaerales bacterium]|nr:phosphate signaling complex protein PhoU [Sedimentisphaerales bacterium]